MDLAYIKQKVGEGEYDLSSHVHQERQEEKITIEEIEQAIFNGDKILIITVYRPKQPVWIDLKIRAKELKSRV